MVGQAVPLDEKFDDLKCNAARRDAAAVAERSTAELEERLEAECDYL